MSCLARKAIKTMTCQHACKCCAWATLDQVANLGESIATSKLGNPSKTEEGDFFWSRHDQRPRPGILPFELVFCIALPEVDPGRITNC